MSLNSEQGSIWGTPLEDDPISRFHQIALTTENGVVVDFQGQDPYILQTEGKTCMIATMDIVGRVAVLDRMFLAKNERGQGIASDMYGRLIGECFLYGIETIKTQIFPDEEEDLPSALAWVRSKGFVETEMPFFFELNLFGEP